MQQRLSGRANGQAQVSGLFGLPPMMPLPWGPAACRGCSRTQHTRMRAPPADAQAAQRARMITAILVMVVAASVWCGWRVWWCGKHQVRVNGKVMMYTDRRGDAFCLEGTGRKDVGSGVPAD